MRKLVAITLLAIFGLPSIMPVFALAAPSATSEANLPACCRRNGKHHCMRGMAERARVAHRDPRFEAPPERCPYCPAQALWLGRDQVFAPPTAQAVYAGLVSHTAVTAQVESWHRISRERSRHKRGPPPGISL